AASLISGLAACALFTLGDYGTNLAGALLFLLSYVLDNTDGEIARLKNQASKIGRQFDNLTDWLVNSLFFLALGFGMAQTRSEDLWLFLGMAGALGGTINYVAALLIGLFSKTPDDDGGEESSTKPENRREWVLYAFREIARWDFCFIVLVLALLDWLWVLLPLGAVGAQAYWMALFFSAARRFQG
ncbi:MAG: CDP-alcohol phosphatidyltransferase family protein, partial [Rhodospirillales bacterium]|nr:CDP-alcohol phosphatidyltransferase family protein [Rhodospirillales bacterium]